MGKEPRYTSLAQYFDATRARYQDIADAAGCSASSICLYIHGKRTPQPDIALRLSRITGVPLGALRPCKPTDHAEVA